MVDTCEQNKRNQRQKGRDLPVAKRKQIFSGITQDHDVPAHIEHICQLPLVIGYDIVLHVVGHLENSDYDYR